MKNCNAKKFNRNRGSVLALTLIVVVILTLIGIGLLCVAHEMRLRAIRFRNETTAMLAAEAGYEKGIFWMNRQSDVIDSLETDPAGSTGSLNFTESSCTYSVQFYKFTGGMPVFRVTTVGTCGDSKRAVDVLVIQAAGGWQMGMCRIPKGSSSTDEVNFVAGEIIDMPIHINKLLNEDTDTADIYIIGSPHFQQRVDMGESRKTSGGADKYSSIISLFNAGIYFDQPDVRITDDKAVAKKLKRFLKFTNPTYCFTPKATVPNDLVKNGLPAVQLEFYVDSGNVGKVCITNHCTVQCTSGNTYDYIIKKNGKTYSAYDIYACHYHDNSQNSADVKDIPVTDTYVTQTFSGQKSPASGQIYVDGNVIIGGNGAVLNQVLQGKLAVVATGNIWIGDSIMVAGDHDASGLPLLSNPNALGLIAGGVIKVIDPGQSAIVAASDVTKKGTTYTYMPVANADGPTTNNRKLPARTVVEAAITVGGGGWGAEYVNDPGGRTTISLDPQDRLVVHGAICEAVRGIVGINRHNGYIKEYYLDSRLRQGVLPSNVWFSGKYVPAPAGWSDYRPTTTP